MNEYSITTYKGTEFDPFSKEIDIRIIARGLARTGRFSGQGSEFYSVAQHSVALSYIMGLENYSDETALIALLHDSPDFLLGDIATPIRKHLKLVFYNGLYNNILYNFLSCFIEPYVDIQNMLENIISPFDKQLTLIEASTLNINTSDWYDPQYNVEPYKVNLLPIWTYRHAEERFMAKFTFLMTNIEKEREK